MYVESFNYKNKYLYLKLKKKGELNYMILFVR